MDYEKILKEALNSPSIPFEVASWIEEKFPQLVESEDEKIRKDIIEHFKYEVEGLYNKGEEYEAEIEELSKYIAWLEKQNPDIELIQKSWYMEGYHDAKFKQEPKWVIKTGEEGPKYELNPRYGNPIMDEHNPTEWSEEDEKMLTSFLHKLEVCDLLTNGENVWAVKRFESLRPHWKPSEEQMSELKMAIKAYESEYGCYDLSPLKSLFRQLKQL